MPMLPRLSHRIFLAILVLGAYSQIVQAILIREGLVVFYGNEVSLGVFFASWLFWVALGSISVLWLRESRFVRQPLPALRLLLLLLPLLLLAQVLALRAVRLLLDVSSAEFVPLGELFLALFLITLPSSLVLGIAFPVGCRALEQAARSGRAEAVGEVARLYVADALGALSGGVLFTFVLVQWFGPAGAVGLLTLALGLTALSLGPGVGRFAGLAVAATGLLLVATPLAPRLDSALEHLRFATLQPGLELLDTVETRYGHVAVARFGEQISVVRDGKIGQSFPQPERVQQEAAYFYAQAQGAKRVLLLGGFAGGLAAELLRYPLERIDQVEEDRRAFERVEPYLHAENRRALQDSRLHLHFGDGRRFVNRLTPEERFDLVLVLDAAPTSAYSNRYFTQEFYQRVRARLTADGVLCTQVSSSSNYLGSTVRSYTASVFATLQAVFPEVAIMPGDEQVYCAAQRPGRVSEDPQALARRYRDTPLDAHRFPAESFRSLLEPERISFVREQLTAGDRDLNRDDKPITYYLNMVLWGKFSASGFVDWLEKLRQMGVWPYLLPLGLLVALWLLRLSLEGFRRARLQRQTGTFALVVLGLIAMAGQLAILFSYQSHVGFMFERVALLNGLFMTGLALGAGLGKGLARRGRAEWALSAVLLVVAGALLGMPGMLAAIGDWVSRWQEGGYLGLSLGLGLLTGTGFPLGFQLAHRDLPAIVRSSGIAQAADNLGGALGGLVTGAFMVPILGVAGSCQLLALFALFALAPLLYARFVPERLSGVGERGYRAFPWSRFGWFLTFSVLLVFGWMQFERQTQPGPQLLFDDDRLMEVSGSGTFELRETPFVHYLGEGGEGGRTLSLSSMTVASDVRGYAGPINLLLAIDEAGRLRGVRHVASRETPSYVAGIDAWLAGLAGEDLGEAPLSLERVDGLSGATVSSQAALEAINRSARAAGEAAFGRVLAPADPHEQAAPAWRSPRFLVTLALLLAFFPVYLSGSEKARLVFQVASLAILGFWLNSLVTETDLVNLSMGHGSSLADNPQRWLLLGFVLVTAILFGQVWCGYLCPFGALQELISRLGRRVFLRGYPDRAVDTRARFLKFLLLALMLMGVWLSGETRWASFNPMQHAFGGHWEGWMGALIGVSLVGALFYVRFWCRYFCPFGAFLALSNKLALLRRLAPRRRFEHCDLGVRDQFDIDCIHCSRCLTGQDTRLRHRPR